MGKKGSKRKTRWRTLSIGAPPGGEDEEDGLRKDFTKSQDKDSNVHTFDRNGQGGYKPRRTGTGTNGSTSSYTSSCSRSHREENSGSPAQPNKIIFNEDEYTRITTPRQDVLFKKGYLSRKKPWTGNASTSATPSTIESQSASHSTADGSETTEDQQLLDRDSGTGEYPPVADSGAQLGYGTFYDHTSGYYYEYPVMFVGPAPVPAHVGPNILAAVPCGPVPLRPIEWINPAFVPKPANQPYCLMDYQTRQSMETATIVEEQNGATVVREAPNGTWSGTGSASCSVAGEIEEQTEEMENITTTEQQAPEQLVEEQHHQHLEEQQQENGHVTTAVESYQDPQMMQETSLMHVPRVVPSTPQLYMYPGHYMFGPPVVSVNGVTIQGGPLVRTMDVSGMTMSCAKRRKKRKKRKQKKTTVGNAEDDEEGEESSECDNDVSFPRLHWSECTTATTVTTIKTTKSQPLNPECKEFLPSLLRTQDLFNTVSTATVVGEVTSTHVNDASDASYSAVEEVTTVNDTVDASSCSIAEEVATTVNDASDASLCSVIKEITTVNDASDTSSCSATEEITTVNHISDAPLCSVAEKITTVNDISDAPSCSAVEIITTVNDASDASSCPVVEEVTTVHDASDASYSAAETEFTVNREITEELFEMSNVHNLAKQEDIFMICDSSQEVVTEQVSKNVRQSKNSIGSELRNQSVEINDFTDSMENTETLAMDKEIENNATVDSDESFGRIENGNDTISANYKCNLFKSKDDTSAANNHVVDQTEENLTNGETNLECFSEPIEQTSVPKSKSESPQSDAILFDSSSRSSSEKGNNEAAMTNVNTEEATEESQRFYHYNNSIAARTSLLTSPRKFSRKGPKFVREPTPGPDLDDQITTRADVENGKIVSQLEAINLSDNTHAVHTDQECVITNDKFDQANEELSHEEDTTDDSDDEIKRSPNVIVGSYEDSIERKTLPEYPITKAVTEWLRRSKSPDTLLSKLASTLKRDSIEKNDDEEIDAKPPKNLHGNPMPALSANSCGEFAKTNNNNNNNINNNMNIERMEANGTSAIGRRKRDAIGTTKRKMSAVKKMNKRNSRNNVDEKKTQSQVVSSLVSCHRLANVVTAVKLRDPSKSNVGDVCEFTQEDSVAGMRVALSSRINSKKVSIKRARTSRRIKKDPVENIDIKMRRIDGAKNNENGRETIDNGVSVRTFEKGEIIVSKDGRLLPTSSYEPVPSDISDATKTAAHVVDLINKNVDKSCEEETKDSSESDENVMMTSSVSIEEPDVLECWEAETIEPVITPKRILQSPGVLCEGEAVEDDNFEIEKATVENVRKYYRLDSAISIEDESSELDTRSVLSVSKSKTVPNNLEKTIEHIHVEEIPIFMPDKGRDMILRNEKIPVDEAIEAYESCFTGGKSPFLTSFDSKMFKRQQPLYIQNGERPMPYRKVCCNIQ